VKIEKKAQRFLEELHIAHELGMVDGEEFLHGLELKDQDVINQKVESQRFIENEAFVLQLSLQLLYVRNLAKLTFPTKTLFVNPFD